MSELCATLHDPLKGPDAERQDPRAIEREMIPAFVDRHGALPFANWRRWARPSSLHLQFLSGYHHPRVGRMGLSLQYLTSSGKGSS